VLGLAMAAAGVLTDSVGPRWVLLGAGVAILVAGFVSLGMTRWLPASRDEQQAVLGAQADAAASQLVPALDGGRVPTPKPAREGSAKGGLERIAILLEEIESRRELEARRSRPAPD